MGDLISVTVTMILVEHAFSMWWSTARDCSDPRELPVLFNQVSKYREEKDKLESASPDISLSLAHSFAAASSFGLLQCPRNL